MTAGSKSCWDWRQGRGVMDLSRVGSFTAVGGIVVLNAEKIDFIF